MNTETTRMAILHAAADEIHSHGFQACHISQIIKQAGVSKGALYHHFSSKLVLGYAVLDEVFLPQVIEVWHPILQGKDPIQAMIHFFEGLIVNVDSACVEKGCPLNNLAQEMSSVDEGFRLRLNQMMGCWQQELSKALGRGQQHRLVDPEVDVSRTATFIIAFIEGAHGLAKNAQDTAMLITCFQGLIDYLQRLKPSAC